MAVPFIPNYSNNFEDRFSFVRKFVVNKDVLDLGCVQHTLNNFYERPDHWLHGFIKQHAKQVVGVDLVKEAVEVLNAKGYNVICADATSYSSEHKFDTIVCGDLIEHVGNPAEIFKMSYANLVEDGVLLITTPNPFAINRTFNWLIDNHSPINAEHVCWFCPQTLAALGARYGFIPFVFSWLSTDFKSHSTRRYWKHLFNLLGDLLPRKRKYLHTDFGIAFVKTRRSQEFRPFVSVIIPTFNRVEMLKDTLSDFCNQDYPKDMFEVVVVDNDSDMKMQEEACAYIKNIPNKPLITYAVEKRRGLVYARHTGTVLAKSEYLVFTDDDGRYPSNYLSSIAAGYNNFPNAAALGTKIVIKWDSEPESWVKEFEPLLGAISSDEDFCRVGTMINGGSFSIKRQALYDVGGFNPGQLGEYIVGDSESGLCKKLAGKFYSVAFINGTQMEHMQFVHKHGTKEDIGRRYKNLALCFGSMSLLGEQGMWNKIKRYCTYLRFMAKYPVEALLKLIKCPSVEGGRAIVNDKKIYFSMLSIFALLKYPFALFFNKEFRKLIFNEEYKLDKKYLINAVMAAKFRSNDRA